LLQAIGAFLTNFFQTPWMLLGLLAIAIPIIIEWLFRKRKRQVDLPTIRYLLRNKEQERIKRQDLLLLLLRMLALFLVALALAQPYVRHSLVGGGRQRTVVVLLDGTASSNQESGMTTAFGQAQRKAEKMIRDLPKDTTVAVGFLGDRVETVATPEVDTHTAAAKVHGLRASSGAAPMTEGLDWLEATLKELKRPGTEVYVFSDFQKRTWIDKDVPAPEIAKRINAIAEGNELYLIDVGGEVAYNYMVTSLQPEEWALSARMPVRFNVRIETTGQPPEEPTEEERPTVTFLVNGVKKDVRSIPPTTQPMTVSFDHMFPGAGEYLVEVVLTGDKHHVDNRRHYIAQIPEDLRVLILDETAGTPEQPNPAPASLFLARAIAPPLDAGMPKVSRFASRIIHPARIIYENLDAYVAVVLTGSDFLREDMVKKLEGYVSEGGALWLFLGPRVNLFQYNRLLYQDGKGLMPYRLARKVVLKDAAELGFETASHPAVPSVKNNPDAAVTGYVELDSASAVGDTRTVMALSDRTPMVAERRYRQGRVLLTAFSVGTDWTYLPARPEFSILVQEMLRSLVGNPDRGVNLEVGDRFRQPLFVSPQQLVLRYPDGKRVRVTPRERPGAEDSWLFEFDATNQQGVYKVDAVEEVLPRRRFVVNQSPAEGDLSRLGRDAFAGQFGSGRWTWIGPEVELPEFVAELHAETHFAPALLWILLAALSVETYLAARFGRRRGGATA
jgi:hypothetical protein